MALQKEKDPVWQQAFCFCADSRVKTSPINKSNEEKECCRIFRRLFSRLFLLHFWCFFANFIPAGQMWKAEVFVLILSGFLSSVEFLSKRSNHCCCTWSIYGLFWNLSTFQSLSTFNMVRHSPSLCVHIIMGPHLSSKFDLQNY